MASSFVLIGIAIGAVLVLSLILNAVLGLGFFSAASRAQKKIAAGEAAPGSTPLLTKNDEKKLEATKEILSTATVSLFKIIQSRHRLNMQALRKRRSKENRAMESVNDKIRMSHIVDAKDLKTMENLVRFPTSPRGLSDREREVLWKYRADIISERKLYTKFIRSINWEATEKDVAKLDEARQLIARFASHSNFDNNDASMEMMAEALELLKSTNKNVRRYGVELLTKLDNEYISLFLLPLVQALRYEDLMDEFFQQPQQQGSKGPVASLASVLLERADQSLDIANKLHWYLTVESESKTHGSLFKTVHYRFLDRQKNSKAAKNYCQQIALQQELVSKLFRVSTIAKEDTAPTSQKRKQNLINALSDPAQKWDWDELFGKKLMSFSKPVGLSLPVDVSKKVYGIVTDDVLIFNSAKKPIAIKFKTSPSSLWQPSSSFYRVIFKSGDDLRQDQLIMNAIQIIDKIWKDNGLDLKLTPYKVMATSTDSGFLEFVSQSNTIADILKKHKTIQEYLRAHNASDEAQAEALENFVQSCAGYCIITYILGIGDRHLDNILITTDGRLFHIDFGFILGCDPKPLPPDMRLSLEMIDAMGGMDSENFAAFKEYCYEAFLVLRKRAALLQAMFELMMDANIPNLIKQRKSKIQKMQDKFKLGMSDAEVKAELDRIINDSIHDLVPHITETVHKIVQEYRA